MKDIHNGLNFHAISVEESVALLNSDLDQGLSEEKAKESLERYGLSSIAEAKLITAFEIFVNQFKSPIVFLLLFAAALSFWFKEWLDGVAIFLVLFINAVIGFYMEITARKSMLTLKKLSSIPAKVLRNGKLNEINSENIVPGDIIFAEAGDMISADGRICRSTQLLIDESALTGESVPVEKKTSILPEETVLADRINMSFKGTYVSKGNAYIIVAATGMQSELAKSRNVFVTVLREVQQKIM